MNPNKPKLRALLDDVLPAYAGPGGPSRAEMLAMLRHERARRRRQRALLAVTGIAALLVFSWPRKDDPIAPTVAVTTVPSAPIVVERVNDEQLFALLEGTPAALLELPDGNSRLLIVRR